jgi:Fe-S cluster biogenesis protein NfuA/nitrite reductase/ring-hydroxylating ferredoxin subunit
MSNNGQHPPQSDALNREGRRIQELIEEIETMPDPATRATMLECIESLVHFYGEGLARILQLVEERGAEGRATYESLINDPVVKGLLLIHDLHPVPLETRLHEALDKIRPYMESHGGNVELISLQDNVAFLRLQGHCKTCPSSTVTMELALRGAIEEACPDLVRFEVEGIPATSLDMEHIPNKEPEWVEIPRAWELAEDSMTAVHAGAAALILCRTNGQLYAYRDHCPACNMPLHLGMIDGDFLECSLGHRYDVSHAGRSITQSSLHLDPLPLLTRDGVVKVALPRESPQAPVTDTA